jgi:protein-S-isoprenylcysteine O-methyltransferase Ste14
VLAPPPLIYLVPLALGLLLHRRYPFEVPGRTVTTVLGLGCILAAAIVLPALLAFRRAATRPEPWRPATALVTEGPYRFSRNPMYLGFTLLYLGIALLFGSLWPLLFLPLVLWVMHFGVIVREEAYLERRFGDGYREYRRRVNRWL